MNKIDVLQYVDSKKTIDLTQQLVRIPSENPPGNEKEVAESVLNRLKSLGLRTRAIEAVEGRTNVIAEHGSGPGPVLILNAHSDVVPAGDGWTCEPYSGTIKDRRLYGRGAADDKGSISAIISAVEAVLRLEAKLNGTLVISIVADEEAGGKLGTGFLVEKGFLKGDMAIVSEPSDFKISVSEGGGVWFDIFSHGQTGHTIDRSAKNAVEKMAKFIVALDKLRERLKTHSHPRYGIPVVSMNTIKAGSKVNIVPGTCTGSLDFRFPPAVGITPDVAIQMVQEIIRDLQDSDPDVRLEFKSNIIAYPFEQPEDTTIVNALKEAGRVVLGKTPEFWRRGEELVAKSDDSDVYHLWTKGKIPSVYFGPGRIPQCHAPDEYIELEQLVSAAKIYSMLIVGALTDLR